jgi:hypothetical protein
MMKPERGKAEEGRMRELQTASHPNVKPEYQKERWKVGNR